MKPVPVGQLTPHPEADRIPQMPADEYAAFLADVRARGVRVPLELAPGTHTVIDGRTRLRAATDAGLSTVPVIDAQMNGEGEVVYMIRAAITRRHLSASVRAVLVLDIEKELAKAAKLRQREGGKKGGSKTATKLPELIPEAWSRSPAKKDRGGEAREQAAAVANVNPRYLSDAKTIAAKAPELLDRVKAGALTIPQARQELKRQEKREALAAKARAAPRPAAGAPDWKIVRGEVGLSDSDPLLDVECDSVRLVFADPPYNIGFDYGEGHDDAQAEAAYLAWAGVWIGQCADLLTPDGSMWVLINDEYAAEFNLALRRAGLTVRNWIIWYESFGVNCADKFNRTKRHLFYCVRDPARFVFHFDAVRRASDRQTKYADARANPAGKVMDDVWFDVPRLVGTADERLPDFPTQLPLALLRRVVACASDPGDLVLDPFCGSGTTGAAAIELGRRFLGVERSRQFHRDATNRLKEVRRADVAR